jgi:hypothetical protein
MTKREEGIEHFSSRFLRRNFSTGKLSSVVDFYGIKAHLVEIKGMPPEVQDQVKRAISDGFISEGKDVLFGNRLHVAKKKETLIIGSSSGSSPKTVKQKQEAPKATAAGSTRNVTCPEGWMGPDEKGECWKLQITSKN